MNLFRITTLIIWGCLLTTPALADNWGPWDTPQKNTEKQENSSISPLKFAVRAFQKYISPVDGTRCPMYPTCSSYALQALHKHGPLLGVFQTVDRLYREGDPHEQQQPINKWGYVRFYDPLDNNDFWLQQNQ
ncbi:MAG: membrane protein insertion efficiency factor YidD [Desulfuromonadales bacterium]|nr:membrane protein insertion efficiency factor YidD [Chloroflexota bacterium]MCK4622693.1 membrane protein insertion efficiency factor YidD [Desulfuromonadales bacterium]